MKAKKMFMRSASPDKRDSMQGRDFTSIKIPRISFGFAHRSVQQLKNDLLDKLDFATALRRLDISPTPSKYRNPFKSRPEPLFKTTAKRNKWAQDVDIDDFIDAMFFRSKNSYRLLNTEFAEPIDYFNSELQLKNMKRLKPIVRGVEAEEVDKTPLEEYWLRNISACTVVRWDLFEEALCRDFCVSINTSIGRVRKINWDYLLKKLLKHIASKNNEIDLWPGHPGLASTPFPGSVVSLSSFQVCITSGKIKKILSKSIRSDTFYLGEKYKNSTYVFACGSRYTGNWKNFKRDGLAKMEVKEGFEYNGYFFKGLRHGYGLCKGMGCEFKGYWEEDLFDGPGEMGYSDLSAINGVWKKGNIVSGRLKFSGGEYTGYFNSLYFEGTGILTAKNGDVKKGTWNHTVNLMETARF